MQQSWRTISPPPHGLSTADGAGVLDEDLGGLGALFWDLARDVILWADSSEEAEEAFARAGERMRISALLGAAAEGLPSSAVMVLAGMVGNPAGARRGVVAAACGRIAEWAEGQGGTATALVFALAAAHCFPEDALRAYRVGRLARYQAEYARAEAWLRYTVLAGRRSGHWEAYGRGCIGLGNYSIQRGNYPAARRFHRRALRTAERFGLVAVAADALHDLCVIEAHVGNLAQAHVYARRAFAARGPSHPRLPRLANDLAYAWMQHGDFGPALRVFEAVLLHCQTPAERLVILSNLARAAAGAGQMDRYDGIWTKVWSLAGLPGNQDHVAQALLELAQGASMLKEWPRAEMAARYALAMASSRREHRVQLAAENLLELAVRERTTVSSVRESRLEQYQVPTEQDHLAEDLVVSLRSPEVVSGRSR